MTENLPILDRGKAIQGLEVHRVPMKMNPKRLTLRHIIIKMPNFRDKERILKNSKENTDNNIQVSSDKASS